MKVMTRGGKPITYLSKVVTTTGVNCCGNCGNTANTGACCTNNVCTVVTHERCTALGGTYLGNLVPCSGVNCRNVSGNTVACCFSNASCSDLSSADCIAAGGTPRGTGTSCSDHSGSGCCTICVIVGPFVRGCTDGDGNDWTGPENCDGTCQGELIPGGSHGYLINYQYCLTCPDNILTGPCETDVYNPVTCELTVTGECHCDGPGQGTTQKVADPIIVCP